MKTNRVAPKAAMLIESMRDIGYTLETALADVVDNSISAGATKVSLLVDSSNNTQKIGILDDGAGMTHKQLLIAMRPGSRNPLDTRDDSDLGRFGLGLKTASFSQCRRLTVVTHRLGLRSAAIWDLKFVAKKDDWLIQIPPKNADIPWADQIGENGTLVVWQDLDRITDPEASADAAGHFVQRVDEAREHLELVFHRYLIGEHGTNKIQIVLNNRPLEPFDPFHSRHPATIAGPVETIKTGDDKVAVQCFTLPHHRKVSPADWEKYGGRGGYLKNQGFYVYRKKRLILHGTWFSLARQMELTKLARVRIDIPNGLDADWKIDVKKASAQPPHRVRERLRRIIEPIVATSKRVYTSRGRILVSDSRLPVWNRIQDKNEISYAINLTHPCIVDFMQHLPPVLHTDFKQILELTSSTIPMDALFSDLGGAPDRVAGSMPSDDTLAHTLKITVAQLQTSAITSEDIREMLQHAEPFRSNWDRTVVLLETLTTLKEGADD